jgi:myo-inositol-1(or 4)-monophosphatase
MPPDLAAQVAAPTSPRLDELAAIAAAACERVRGLLRRPLHAETKSDNTPVTGIDLAIDRMLRRQLTALWPQARWLSEETADRSDRRGAEWLWVVDPIDGTRSMIEGQPEFCVSVALVQTGPAGAQPVLGVVANPSTGEVFLAERGAGAFDGNGKRMHATEYDGERQLRVVLSRSDVRHGLFYGLLDGIAWQLSGSLAYKMALVARGDWDGHVTPGPRSEWDAAAGALLLAEAGGRASDLAGEPLRFNQRKPHYQGVIVASDAAYPAMRAFAQRLRRA